ncbi:Interferon regulatory factor 5 [Bagarius yarrelli]|uniref:Interferon regulatory factor 5 n=1 Tax=Bagarius yarrelli TaxID=175774 RepID=A0A556TIE3_BAGYA|nr:Interferon regulatory factor 5 [Bagarius yarrelli]
MAQPKPLFIPWLKQQIDSGRYPGVQWVNQECTEFSIPWKHALRQDSNSDDILIFKAWARTSANSNGQVSGDSSVWKRNFRSTLRARGFKTVKDNKNDAANPHKIFLWPDDAQSGASTESSPVCNDEISLSDALYLGEEDLFPGKKTTRLGDEDLFPGVGKKPGLLQYLADLNIVETSQEMPLDQLDFIADASQLTVSTTICDAPFSIQETSSTPHFSAAHISEASTGQFSPEGTLALNQYSPPECAFNGTQPPEADLEQLPAQATSNHSGMIYLLLYSNQFGTHFRVNIYYRGKQVLNQVVENEDGFCLKFRNDPNLMASAVPVVQLPGTESILDQFQAQLTQSILDNLGGLEVRRVGSMLLGYRWGDSRVYWGLDKHEQRSTSRPLSKNEPEPIYCLKDFVSGMMALIQNCGTSPSYSLYFFLGQQWPDPKNKPWEKKLIMVEVILTALEKLKTMAVENGATSMQSSMDLQISLEQMMELC